MEIKFLINDEQFDIIVGEAMKAKVKQILRTDKDLKAIVHNTLQEELTKRINSMFEDKKISRTIDIEVKAMLANLASKAMNTVEKKVKEVINPHLETVNKLVIQELFKDEITTVKRAKHP